MKKFIKKISVIVPNYNGGKFLQRCLDSVVDQKYPSKEIIIIDDGSDDDSLRIVDNYMNNHAFIKLIKTKHCGPNAARKVGVQKASGDYIMFVDSDDFMESGAMLELIGLFEKYNVDVIRFNARYYPQGEIVLPVPNWLEGDKKTLNHSEVVDLLTTTCVFNSLWSQIYKASFIKNAKAFNLNIDFGEDLLINAEVHKKTKSVLMVRKALYNYCINSNSITNTLDAGRVVKNVLDRTIVSREMIKYASKEKMDPYCFGKVSYEQYKMLWNTLKKIVKIEGYDKKRFMRDFEKTIHDNNEVAYCVKDLLLYVKRLGLIERILNKKAIVSIAKSDCNSIWVCLNVYGWLQKRKTSLITMLSR